MEKTINKFIPIGESFNYKDNQYLVVKGSGIWFQDCLACSFYINLNCPENISCKPSKREDNTSVYFKEIK